MKSIVLCGLTVVLATSACDAPPDPRVTNFRVDKGNVAAQYDAKSGRLKRMEVDTNGDGKFDTWQFSEGTQIERIEIDRDFNGMVDRWEYYAENKLVKVGSSTRGDGVADQWAYADDGGMLRRIETDSDRDGRIDKWESFAAPAAAGGLPVLVCVELDTDKRGAPTQRLMYRRDGSLERVEQLSSDRP